jgi:hypothetical protein
MFRFGPARTGYNPVERTISMANVSGLTKRFFVAGGAHASIVVETTPAVANGIGYTVGEVYTDYSEYADVWLIAFDAGGKTNCSGTPAMCEPLWIATAGVDMRPYEPYSPAVVGGVVYVSSGNGLSAFDATGTTNCSGTPKICTPLWTATIRD